jgi:hypothetical protein
MYGLGFQTLLFIPEVYLLLVIRLKIFTLMLGFFSQISDSIHLTVVMKSMAVLYIKWPVLHMKTSNF